MAEVACSVQQALSWAMSELKGQERPRAEAEILLAHVLKSSRSFLWAWPEHLLSVEQWSRFQRVVQRRAEGWPVAYLTGEREFFGLPLQVSEDVLIPRPETELLVEAALARLPQGPCVVADLGTGSGAIALAIASQRPEVRVMAVDASPRALALARANAERLGVSNVEFYGGDWCTGLPALRFDLLVSNPPYLRANDPHLGQGDLRFEPRMALVAGEDGLEAVRAILACAPAHLSPEGWLLLEHGYDQGKAVADLMHAAGWRQVLTLTDWLGHGRVTLGQPPVGSSSASVE